VLFWYVRYQLQAVSLSLLGSVLFLPFSTQKVLSYCGNGIGTIIYIAVVDQLVHPLS